MSVPYAALFDEIRRNHGFMDLRGRPDLVASIPEALQSEALKALLLALSESSSPVFTIGCDLGMHEQADEEGPRNVAGAERVNDFETPVLESLKSNLGVFG